MISNPFLLIFFFCVCVVSCCAVSVVLRCQLAIRTHCPYQDPSCGWGRMLCVRVSSVVYMSIQKSIHSLHLFPYSFSCSSRSLFGAAGRGCPPGWLWLKTSNMFDGSCSFRCSPRSVSLCVCVCVSLDSCLLLILRSISPLLIPGSQLTTD